MSPPAPVFGGVVLVEAPPSARGVKTCAAHHGDAHHGDGVVTRGLGGALLRLAARTPVLRNPPPATLHLKTAGDHA